MLRVAVALLAVVLTVGLIKDADETDAMNVNLLQHSRKKDDPCAKPNGAEQIHNACICAEQVLATNWNTEAGFTTPSASQYPHQWNWDSAFIAIGQASYDTNKAKSALKALFNGQWQNGMIPHTVFNLNSPPDSYFPGYTVWQSKSVAGEPDIVKDKPSTSDLTNPPIVSEAIMRIGKEDKGFLVEMFPALDKYLSYLHDMRGRDLKDTSGKGLVYVRHPWENGMDNLKLWDLPLFDEHQGITQRQLMAEGVLQVWDELTESEKMDCQGYPESALFQDAQSGEALGETWKPSAIYKETLEEDPATVQGLCRTYIRRDLQHVKGKHDRPPHEFYDRVVYLLRKAKKQGYDENEIKKDMPFEVYDGFMNALTLKAYEDMQEMASFLGNDDIGDKYKGWARDLAADMEELWDDTAGIYVDLNKDGTRMVAKTYAGLAPIVYTTRPEGLEGEKRQAHVEKLIDAMASKGFCGDADPGTGTVGEGQRNCLYAIPSMSTDDKDFDATRYWRGPIWINVEWLFIRGLERQADDTNNEEKVRNKARDLAQTLKQTVKELIGKHGMYEYFNPLDGSPHGIGSFSWTASLYHDLFC